MAYKHEHSRLTKHDRYILELKNKIKHKYDFVSTNIKISGKKRSLGEIDLLGKKGNSVDMYEVKCSHRILKAKKQLQRIKKLMNFNKGKSYFYCGSSGVLVGV